MTVTTVVQGEISSSSVEKFEKSFSAAKEEALPEGLVSTILLKNVRERGVYRIQTVWRSLEALEKMRSTTPTPKAFELFLKAGAKPTIDVYEIVDTIP